MKEPANFVKQDGRQLFLLREDTILFLFTYLYKAKTFAMRIEIYTKSTEMPELINGPVLHSAMAFRTFEHNSKDKPYMLVAYYSNGEEAGHLLIVRKRSIRIFPPVLSVWYSIMGEGAYSSRCKSREELFACFLEKVFDMFDFRHSFIEVQNIEDSRFAYGILRSHNFIPILDHRNYISLHSKEPEERLSRKYRAHIRNGEKRGVTWRRASSDEEIREALKLMKNFYRSKTRKRLPDTEALFGMLHNSDGTLSDDSKMFIVLYKDRIIGSSICMYEDKRALLAFSCGLRKRYPLLYPGITAIWAALSDAHRNGYPHFEFLEVRTLSRLRKSFLSTIDNFGGKDVGTLRWYHFKWNWLNKFLRWIYV